MWTRMVIAAQAKLAAGTGDRTFYESKLHTARFFMQRMLPEVDSRFKAVMAGKDSLMAMDASGF
jgi:hypothetical protein